MNRTLPALKEALEDWRDLASDRDAAESLLDFDVAAQRLERLRLHLDKLRGDPPQFDAMDLAAVLDDLSSAQRQRQQILEGNEVEVVVPTLRAFLFDDEESLEEKFAAYPARIRYAGHAILGELWGWAHIEQWPIYSQRALTGLRLLGWEVPKQDYPLFARAFADLRAFYEEGARVTPSAKLPLHLEIDQFLSWVNGTMPAQRPTPEASAPSPSERPRPAQRRSYALREFGAPYDVSSAPLSAWPDQPLAPPGPARLAEAEARIRQQLALPPAVIRRAAAHLLAGRHLILTGAPGTGKSHLATLLASELFGVHPMLVTATAEWSTFDVVGGLVPLAGAEGQLRYDVRPGVVYEALRRNWLLAEDGTVRRDPEGQPLRVGTTHEGRQWPGVWLIIDELNRADVDKAFGDLFTALESGTLRVPRAGVEASILIPLPRDFRIIATLNTRDRHFLFTLSDALKRRFAFVEVETPTDTDEERAILLHRTLAALHEQGLAAEEPALQSALAQLYPMAQLLRAFHPLGTAPLLAALRYVGAAQQLGAVKDEVLLQEAIIAEILPQLEGMRDLPLRLLATLTRGERDAALALLADALTHAYGDPLPLRTLHALAGFLAPALAERVATLQRSAPSDPALLNEALTLLDALRARADALPAPRWPQVAAQLDAWLAER
ncbi:MAG: AAA family ATPase [Ardenticatenales bacterium]|nr:AAA family ATPase [Ardenticatenales bacterium]